mgnify:CR=1 FL=1
MIRIVRVIRDRELHALDLAVEVVADRTVVRRNRGTRILTDIETVVGEGYRWLSPVELPEPGSG